MQGQGGFIVLRRILTLVGPHRSADRPAVARAAALAERSGAVLELLDVVYDPHLQGYLGHSEIYESLRRRVVEDREAQVKSLAAQFEQRGLRCSAKAEWAHPVHMAVVREAVADDVDLVVFGAADASRGLSQDEWRLVSTCPAPVLVVRGERPVPYAEIIAAVDPARSHDKPSNLDLRIVEQAVSFRNLHEEANLEVVHCVPPLTTLVTDALGRDALRDADALLRAGQQRELQELVQQAGLPHSAGVLVDGRPADVLARRSAADSASLLVIGTVSRGPIARLLIGSTAERVLRGTGGDVLVVKPPGFGFSPTDVQG